MTIGSYKPEDWENFDDWHAAKIEEQNQQYEIAARRGPGGGVAIATVAMAQHAFVTQDIVDDEAIELLDDAIERAEGEASSYRRIVVLLEGYIDELEQWAGVLHRAPDDETCEATLDLREALASEADQRAKRARVRSRLAAADDKAVAERSKALRQEWLAWLSRPAEPFASPCQS